MGEHEYAVVEAAQRGVLWAQDELVGAYLPLVYNIVGRALNGHADVDDVVQETMLRALRALGSLDHPGSFRSWLVAITMNQIRTYQHRQQVAPAGSELQEAHDVADPGADFVDLTIVRLGLEGQRREVAQATRWLDGDDRMLLSLWWLEAVGELSRAEVSAALDLSLQHTAVRVQRMKAQLETARLVVRALSATPLCTALDQLVGNWDGRPSPLWRKRIARHARDCVLCSGHQAELFPAEGLLVGLGLVPVAAALSGLAGPTAFPGAETVAEATPFGTPEYPDRGRATATADHGHAHVQPDSGAAAGPEDATAALEPVRAAHPRGRHGHRPRRRIPQRGRITGVAAAVAVLLAGGTVATLTLLPDGEGDTVRSAADTQSETPPASSSASPAPSASPSPSRSKSPSAKPSTKSPKPTPTPSRTKPAPATPEPRRSATVPATAADTPAAQVLALVNSEREKAGCRPVKRDDRLARAAQLHSEDMSANQYFDHTGLDGRSFVDRAAAQGHPSPGAENIARGQSTPEAVMESWMNSPGHRENILNCSLTTMGLGVVDDDWTWTQVFGF